MDGAEGGSCVEATAAAVACDLCPDRRRGEAEPGASVHHMVSSLVEPGRVGGEVPAWDRRLCAEKFLSRAQLVFVLLCSFVSRSSGTEICFKKMNQHLTWELFLILGT